MLLRRSVITAVALASLLCGAYASAQGTEQKITGVVRDTTGSTLPGVTVTATSQSTRATQTATTGNDGTYSLSLPSGGYTVSAALTGFRSATQTVELGTAASAKLDFSLQVSLSERVTVTAMKREQTVLDVPFSVAAPTEEVLRSRGVNDIEGVAANVGGFTVQNLGPGQSQVAIRGLSAGQIVRDQPGVKEQVGTYLDESVISMSLFTPDLDLFDTNRVEVLRGPQGTLFGSGSESGTVRYITNQPQLNVTKGFADFEGSSISSGSMGGNAKFGFNVPLGKTAAARVATYYDHAGGFIDAVQPNLSVNEHVNDGFKTGVRAAVTFEPDKNLSITPRFLYQKTDLNGWNRVDVYNILANPFTTRRPKVTLGDRQQFTQVEEPFTDKFGLGDLNINYTVGDMTFTSVTSYNRRDVLVVRDAGALTSSITGGSIGLPASVYTLNSPLNDATKANTWTQEGRLSGKGRVPWVAGVFYSRQHRHYGQDLPVTGFTRISGIPTAGLRAPTDSLFWSDLDYKLNQVAVFGETTVPVTDAFSITGGLRFYHFNEDKAQIFDGIFGNDDNGKTLVSQPGTTSANGVAPRVIATWKVTADTNLNAQVSRGFRLGGINDPLNVPLCTPQDLVTFGGRETWKDEKVWNYEGGIKSRVLNGNGAVNVSAFYMDINDLQATVTAGSCSSRVIFNVPKAKSQGVEFDFELAPVRHVDLAVSGTFNDSTLKSTLTSTSPTGAVSVVGGIQSGRRLPTVPKVQIASAATYTQDVGHGAEGYVTGTYQHIGSRFTQLGDQDLGTLNLLSFGASTIGGPLTASVFTYNPELPAYDLVNLRAGVRREVWDISFFVNNVTNELAYLAFDQERGTRARISFLTNQPRTFGIQTHFNF